MQSEECSMSKLRNISYDSFDVMKPHDHNTMPCEKGFVSCYSSIAQTIREWIQRRNSNKEVTWRLGTDFRGYGRVLLIGFLFMACSPWFLIAPRIIKEGHHSKWARSTYSSHQSIIHEMNQRLAHKPIC